MNTENKLEPICPDCGSDNLEWRESTITTFGIEWLPHLPPREGGDWIAGEEIETYIPHSFGDDFEESGIFCGDCCEFVEPEPLVTDAE